MTETNKDGEKSDSPKNGKEAGDFGKTVPFPQGGKETEAAGQANKGPTPTQVDPTIGVDEGHTFIEIRIPFAVGYWKTMGFIQEIMVPTVRRFYIEKAQKSALKKKLISPSPGFRGFNPKQWFKK